jgi:hypothetical protein
MCVVWEIPLTGVKHTSRIGTEPVDIEKKFWAKVRRRSGDGSERLIPGNMTYAIAVSGMSFGSRSDEYEISPL